jgi:hypothetical protein
MVMRMVFGPLPHLPTPVSKSHSTIRNREQFLCMRPRQPPPDDLTKIIIIKSIDVRYAILSQTVIAKVLEGLTSSVSKLVFLKFYDSLFIDPESIESMSIVTCGLFS